MTSKKQARRALVASFTSLLLCFAMLIGTTFAWFTDVAETGLNQIIAGNLDIELLDANGNNIEGSTELFVKPELWEPGAVAYAQMQVKNVGNLDLKYSVCVNYENVNYLNNHGLSEVLKYAVIDLAQVDMSGDDNADRAAVLAAAMAAKQQGNLYDYTYKSELKAGETKALDTFVVFWAPNNASVDNLYNVNNGQKTSDGKPLQINLGIKVVATQLNSEEDSFGPDYDLNAPQLIMVNGKYYEDLATAIADAKAGGYTLQLLGGAMILGFTLLNELSSSKAK
jgi:predicted ribosomally synthesized peptide with SipW-like signal peptide